MVNGQLEMNLGSGRGCHNGARHHRRQGRAHWWFERMRQVVDRAIDWEPAPPPRPEQIWVPNAHRQAGAPVTLDADERQICE